MASTSKMNKLNRKIKKGGLWSLLTNKSQRGSHNYFYTSSLRKTLKEETNSSLKEDTE